MEDNKVDICFTEWRSDGSKVELQFTENEDEMDIFKFRDFCARFAIAMSYAANSVKTAFGDDVEI